MESHPVRADPVFWLPLCWGGVVIWTDPQSVPSGSFWCSHSGGQSVINTDKAGRKMFCEGQGCCERYSAGHYAELWLQSSHSGDLWRSPGAQRKWFFLHVSATLCSYKMTFHKNKSALHPVSTSDLKNVFITSTIHIKDTSSLTVAIFLFVVIFLTLCANYTSPWGLLHQFQDSRHILVWSDFLSVTYNSNMANVICQSQS